MTSAGTHKSHEIIMYERMSYCNYLNILLGKDIMACCLSNLNAVLRKDRPVYISWLSDDGETLPPVYVTLVAEAFLQVSSLRSCCSPVALLQRTPSADRVSAGEKHQPNFGSMRSLYPYVENLCQSALPTVVTPEPGFRQALAAQFGWWN